jgi:hypothetical protein
MSLPILLKGETLALQFDLADESGAAVAWAELQELQIILKVNNKPQEVLSKTGETITQGEAIGAVLINIASDKTSKWPTGKLTAELVLTIDGDKLIAVAELYKVKNSEFADI